MARMRLALVAFMIIMLATTSLFPASAEAAKKLYVGGTMSLTGAYAEDTAAVRIWLHGELRNSPPI